MTYKTRTILFLSLLILFLIAATLTVSYSLGWRFNWKTKKITQPGIFYFKVWPRNVQIYLDDKLEEKTDFFFGSTLVENLLSKEYKVKIKKEEFHVWEKTLEIRKREVTEVKNIVLIPENPNFRIITNEVNDFFFSPDGKKIVLKENWLASRSSPGAREGWSLKLFEIDKNVKSHLIDESDISKKKVQLFDLKFSPDSKKVLLEVGLKEKISYYLLDIDKSPAVLSSLDFLDSPEKLYFHPKNSQKLFVFKEKGLRELNLSTREISSPILKNIIAFAIIYDDIYYLDSSGFIFKNNLSFDQEEKLNIISFSIKEETKYEITVFNSYLFLQEDDTLYIFDRGKKFFEEFFESIRDFKFSYDPPKMVYLNNYEIWVLFLEKKYEQPQKEAGEKLFITRFSEKIDDIFWYTNHYLIFNAGDKIKVAEIDDRDRINIVDLTEFKEPKIFWSNKKLYILSEENLHVSEELTP